MKFRNSFIIVVCLALLTSAVPAGASVSSEVLEQAVNLIFRGAAKETAEQLVMAGGRAAVREVLENAAREGGELLVQRCTRLLIEEGSTALRVLRQSPRLVVSALEHLPAASRRTALLALEREGPRLLQLIEIHGPSALQAAIRHPGVGSALVGKLGAEGLALSSRLTTDQAIMLARHADDIARLAVPEKTTLMQMLALAPERVISYLEAHPNILAIGTAAVAVYAMRDHLFGNPDAAASDPAAPRGFVDRIVYRTLGTLEQLLRWISIALASIIVLYGSVKIYWMHRRNRQSLLQSAPAPANDQKGPE